MSCLSDSQVFGEAYEIETKAKQNLFVNVEEMKQSVGPQVEPPSFKIGGQDTLEQIP